MDAMPVPVPAVRLYLFHHWLLVGFLSMACLTFCRVVSNNCVLRGTVFLGCFAGGVARRCAALEGRPETARGKELGGLLSAPPCPAASGGEAVRGEGTEGGGTVGGGGGGGQGC